MIETILLANGTFSRPIEFGNGRFVCKINDTLRTNCKIVLTNESVVPTNTVVLLKDYEYSDIAIVEYQNRNIGVATEKLDYEDEDKTNKTPFI